MTIDAIAIWAAELKVAAERLVVEAELLLQQTRRVQAALARQPQKAEPKS